ncbi:MAG: gala protein [Acidobacteriota bacterium]
MVTPRRPIDCPDQHVDDVVLCPPTELDDLLAWLAEERPTTEPRAFPRGTALPDGRLDLCKQAVGPSGLQRVVERMRPSSGVRHLLLGLNGLGDAGAERLAEGLDGSHLETVFLGCNRIGVEGLSALTPALEANPRLRGLWLKRNPIGDEGARDVARLLRRHESLRTLDLVNTGLGPEGLAEIVEALVEDDRPLERLYLGGNQLGLESAELLARLVSESKLTELFVSANRLGDDGCRVLAEALEGSELRVLSLASNGLGPDGLGFLLPRLGQLHALDLGYVRSTLVLGEAPNRIADVGAREVATFLSRDTTLRRLDLRNNGLTGRGARALEDGLQENETLVELTLGKGVPRRVKRRISEILRRNAATLPDDVLACPPDLLAIQSVYRTHPAPVRERAERS